MGCKNRIFKSAASVFLEINEAKYWYWLVLLCLSNVSFSSGGYNMNLSKNMGYSRILKPARSDDFDIVRAKYWYWLLQWSLSNVSLSSAAFHKKLSCRFFTLQLRDKYVRNICMLQYVDGPHNIDMFLSYIDRM